MGASSSVNSSRPPSTGNAKPGGCCRSPIYPQPRALASALKKVAGHPYASLIFHPGQPQLQPSVFCPRPGQYLRRRVSDTSPPCRADPRLGAGLEWSIHSNSLPMQPNDYRELADTPVQQRRGSAIDGSPSSRILAASPAAMTTDLDAPQEWLPDPRTTHYRSPSVAGGSVGTLFTADQLRSGDPASAVFAVAQSSGGGSINLLSTIRPCVWVWRSCACQPCSDSIASNTRCLQIASTS